MGNISSAHLCILMLPLSCAAVVSISRMPASGSSDSQLSKLLFMGHAPINRLGTEDASKVAATPSAEPHMERVFLDLSMCFNDRVQLSAVEFFVADVSILHANRFRWHILHPIPSMSQAATQWFTIKDAWPIAGSDEPVQHQFPSPGAYRLDLDPPYVLSYADCVGWSLKGPGDGPFAFESVVDAEVTWAASSGGLHDAVELFVKRGKDPITSSERLENHLEWTGLIQRAYSMQVVYQTAPAAPKPADTGKDSSSFKEAPLVNGGNPACWKGGYTFEQCCIGAHADKDDTCWDAFFTFERCCTLTSVKRFADMDFTPPAEAHYNLFHLRRDNLPRLGPVQDDEALLLYAFVRVMRARTIVEFGTSNGFSGINWMHAIADDPHAMVYSYDILPYPAARNLEDSDPRFVFHQKSQADFQASDVEFRTVDIAFFDAGHLVEYSLKAFERVLSSLAPTAVVAVHDTGLHVLDYGTGAPQSEEGLPFSDESCSERPGGAERCHRFQQCSGSSNEHGFCVARAHRPSEREFVRAVLERWPEFHPLHLHSRRVFRHGLTILQRGNLWDTSAEPGGTF